MIVISLKVNRTALALTRTALEDQLKRTGPNGGAPVCDHGWVKTPKAVLIVSFGG